MSKAEGLVHTCALHEAVVGALLASAEHRYDVDVGGQVQVIHCQHVRHHVSTKR